MKITRRANPVVVIIALILIIALIIAGPLLGIWALNTLFPQLAIPYDVFTWLAMCIVMITVGPRVRVDKQN